MSWCEPCSMIHAGDCPLERFPRNTSEKLHAEIETLKDVVKIRGNAVETLQKLNNRLQEELNAARQTIEICASCFSPAALKFLQEWPRK